jgi:antitoxin HicB
MSKLEYPIVVEPLPIEEGGGFLATAPDLPGCMSDGPTPEEAVSNIQDAIIAWVESARDLSMPCRNPHATRRWRDEGERSAFYRKIRTRTSLRSSGLRLADSI